MNNNLKDQVDSLNYKILDMREIATSLYKLAEATTFPRIEHLSRETMKKLDRITVFLSGSLEETYGPWTEPSLTADPESGTGPQ